jgi:hypothetical protein
MRKLKQVKIKSVSFRSSIQLKEFQHVHIEAAADVPVGESAGHTLDVLKKFVAAELRRAKEGEVPAAREGQFRV